MTRYSRSVIPGRPDAAVDPAELDRQVFGAKKRAFPPSAANDEDNPDFLPPVEDEEAGQLIARASSDRRKGDRRAAGGQRRQSDYAPLPKADRGYRTPEDNKRGPMLLVGALVIVAVFGVVVWNAYREGVKTDEPPQLASAGAFKTPVKDMAQAVTPVPEESAEVLEQLEGSPAAGHTPAKPTPESHPDPAPVKAAPPPAPAAKAPVQTASVAPSKVTAPPPAPLKQPAAPAPAAKPPVVTAAIALTPPLAPPPKSEPVKVAAAPAPAPAAGAYKPAFAASGNWVAQIAAPSSEAGAVSEWERRAKASPELFSAAERFVIQADVNGKTVYRLRAGSFVSKADADAFCAAFKAKGGNCFPAAK